MTRNGPVRDEHDARYLTAVLADLVLGAGLVLVGEAAWALLSDDTDELS